MLENWNNGASWPKQTVDNGYLEVLSSTCT